MTEYMKRVLLVLFCAHAVASLAGAAGVSHKPRLPVEISIGPTQPGITQDSIKPGQTIEFNLSATAPFEITEIQIDIKLQGGAEPVAGDLSWSGPASNGELKQVVFTVRAPESGTGRIRATVSYFNKDRQIMKRTVQYLLGTQQGGGEVNKPGRLKKDSQGRDIVEYE